MTEHNQQLPDGATPLNPDEAAGLKPRLRTRAELNAFEQANIAQAMAWGQRSRILKNDLLNIDSLKLLHKRMFDDTWKWAGTFRTTGKNIGVEPHQIQMQLSALCDDAKYWIENQVFPLDECAVRIHHRLVFVHPFSNGNGRHARLTADLILMFAKAQPLTWGGQSLDIEGKTRRAYIAALKAADQKNYAPLLKFAKHL